MYKTASAIFPVRSCKVFPHEIKKTGYFTIRGWDFRTADTAPYGLYGHVLACFLLSSRLYCRFRIHTGSAAIRRSRTVRQLHRTAMFSMYTEYKMPCVGFLPLPESPSVGNLCRRSRRISPCPEEFLDLFYRSYYNSFLSVIQEFFPPARSLTHFSTRIVPGSNDRADNRARSRSTPRQYS